MVGITKNDFLVSALCTCVTEEDHGLYIDIGSNNGLAYSKRIINYAGMILSITCSFCSSHYAAI